jgi:hypothetical protein
MRCLLVLAACANSTLKAPRDGGQDQGVLDGGVDQGVPDGSVDQGARDLAMLAGDLAMVPGVPENHRTNDSACSTVPSPGTCTLVGGFPQCHMDAQCTSGVNGRCIQSTSGALTCNCTYDTCSTDADCAPGETCVCHGTAYSNGAGNTCVAGNCRVDADCPGFWCSPSVKPNICGGKFAGYYCHTAGDLCTNDADCPKTGPQMPYCLFSTTNLRWECAPVMLCP